MVKNFRLEEFGFEAEIGKVALQADGSLFFKHGGTVILATVVSAESKEFPGFLPLTVDYKEQLAAAGKIPGGYYKREGRPSDREVLTSRLIDRAIRPLFPANFFDQVQVLVTVYSVDKRYAPNTIALVAASLALSISKISFLGPVGAVEVARIDDAWVVNPTYEDSVRSQANLTVAGTKEGICMVEGAMNELPEKDLIDALFCAHDAIKKLVVWQEEIQKEIGKAKVGHGDDWQNWGVWEKLSANFLTSERVEPVFVSDKEMRSSRVKELKDEFLTQNTQELEVPGIIPAVVEYIFKSVMKEKITELILNKNKRVDGRDFTEIRKITTEVGLLPFTHGSALFTRGQTQALVTVTLGGGQDEQRFENVMDTGESIKSSFMLHYNFPPFSVGEVRMLRGPGRREVGHGYLAASSFKYVLPSKEEFPYTIRIVADMLESNGSTSMATACGSTMALMHAGVPIKKMVGGIAMGLLRNATGQTAVLSDISGFEDDFGLMDFKVVGTHDGVTAIQLDIKYKGGFSREVFESALAQAREGRLHILGEMQKVMTKPNEQLSDLVPKVTTLHVAPDKIGGIIGGGGKTIREIIEVTKTTIDIESDGLVKIFGGPEANTEMAIRWVKVLAGQIDVGTTFKGKIRKFADFGIFVELVPGVDGLVHISNIPRHMQRTYAKDLALDQLITVHILDHDDVSGRISLRLVEDDKAK
ncbi:MAG: polyribonucleotide nucleotidyltransferase [Candidatus Dependentiae bacterium]|nr:polyribonucleotide nucleotidyltransferase [Candidatus Dependentiae bacterium]